MNILCFIVSAISKVNCGFSPKSSTRLICGVASIVMRLTVFSLKKSPKLKSSTCNNSSSTYAPILVDTVLSFIKAYCLKGDKDSLKMVVNERFSLKEVEAGKSHLWEYCRGVLEANGLHFHVRRDSDRRSQLIANLDDFLMY